VTTATDIGGRQRTPTDSLSQARLATALAVRVGTWLRDEEAAGSNPATPTGKQQVTRHLVACRLHYAFPGVRFWEPFGREHR
jgi:hypothetical protein